MNTNEIVELMKDTIIEYRQYCRSKECESDKCAIRRAQLEYDINNAMCRATHIGFKFDVLDDINKIEHALQQYCFIQESCYACPTKLFIQIYLKDVDIGCQSVYFILHVLNRLDLIGV